MRPTIKKYLSNKKLYYLQVWQDSKMSFDLQVFFLFFPFLAAPFEVDLQTVHFFVSFHTNDV